MRVYLTILAVLIHLCWFRSQNDESAEFNLLFHAFVVAVTADDDDDERKRPLMETLRN